MPSQTIPKPAQRLSQSNIAALKPGERDYFVRDSEIRGLQLKVTPAGNKSFVIRYRNSDGRERKHKLGNYPALNASAARRMAQELLGQVAVGEDPAAGRLARKRDVCLFEYAERFLREHVEVHLAASTAVEYRRLFERYLFAKLGRVRLSSITRDDFETIKRDLRDTPHQANRVLAVARKLFNHAIQNGHAEVTTNPVLFVKSFKEHPRERILTKSEQERIAEAIAELRVTHPENTSSYDAIVFLFLTGRRRSEVLQLQWRDIDFERNVVYYRKTKTDPQKSSMTPDMREFLLSIKATSHSEHVFPGRTRGKPLTDPKRSWESVKRLAGLEGVRLHDIRHTVISEVTANSDLQSAALVAGHKSLQSTMRYVHGLSVATNALQKAGSGRTTMLHRDLAEGEEG